MLISESSVSLDHSVQYLKTDMNEKTSSESKDKDNMKGKIESEAKERLYNSIAQAVIRIIETPYITLKVFILICILTVTGLSSYLVIGTFLDFFSYEVMTKTRTLSEIPAEFPKVTICNCIFF